MNDNLKTIDDVILCLKVAAAECEELSKHLPRIVENVDCIKYLDARSKAFKTAVSMIKHVTDEHNENSKNRI